jgi:tetratricopeptide (TPR) repeat protein
MRSRVTTKGRYAGHLLAPLGAVAWALLLAAHSNSAPVQGELSVLDAIEQIESDHGVYSAELSEHLLSLAQNYSTRGDHEDAVEVLNRAVHVQRINGGLYSLSQAPILEQIIEGHMALGQWDEATKRHRHLYWLHERNYGRDDPRILPMLEKVSSWHLNAYSLTNTNGASHLMNAYQMLQKSVDIITKNFGSRDERLVQPLQSLAVSNYYLATLKSEQARSTNELRSSRDNELEAERVARLNHYVLNSFYNGKAAINKIVSIYEADEQADPLKLIESKVQLGDWYMLWDRPNAAMDSYREAFDAMADDQKLSQTRTEIFGKAVALPDMPMLQAKAHDPNNPHDYVLVKFDVTSRGTARNIKILESKPADSVGNRAIVRRNLKKAKFRPKIVDGKAVVTEGIVHRYVMPKS